MFILKHEIFFKIPLNWCSFKSMQQIFFMVANKINCLGKQRLHQILEFEICSFLNLLSDWSIQKFWKKYFLNFWINQSEKREGKFKIEKWSNFGPRYCQIGTKIGTSNIRIVIHMVKRVSERLNRKIGDGVTGPIIYKGLDILWLFSQKGLCWLDFTVGSIKVLVKPEY